MKKLLIVIAAMSFIACKQTKPATALVQNKNFDAYKENFINSLWTIYPNWASSIGFHKNDSLLTIPDDAQRKKEIAFAESQLDSLHLFNLDSLNNQNKVNLIDVITLPYNISHLGYSQDFFKKCLEIGKVEEEIFFENGY
jgi:hypothetical protein